MCVIYLSSNFYIKQDAIGFDERSILHPFTEVVLGKTEEKGTCDEGGNGKQGEGIVSHGIVSGHTRQITELYSYRKLYPGDIGVSGLSSLGEGDNEKGE